MIKDLKFKIQYKEGQTIIAKKAEIKIADIINFTVYITKQKDETYKVEFINKNTQYFTLDEDNNSKGIFSVLHFGFTNFEEAEKHANEIYLELMYNFIEKFNKDISQYII